MGSPLCIGVGKKGGGVGKKYAYLATGRQERVKRNFIGESEKTRD